MNQQPNRQVKIDRLALKLKSVYRGLPAWLRFVLAPLEFVYYLDRVLRPDLWIMTGEETSSSRELTIIFTGNNQNRYFLKNLAFHSCSRDENIGKTWLWNVSKICRSFGQHDTLLINEIPRYLRILFKDPMTWYVPCWVYGELYLSADHQQLVRNRSLRSDINKIKKANLTFETASDTADCHEFYHSMHLPFVTQSHHDGAVVTDYAEVLHELKRCDLVFVRNEEERLAGALIRYSKNRAELWFLGVKDGNPEYVKLGVIGALYYYPILYFKSKGIQRVDFGPSRAFLKNGVLQYKRKWDQTLSGTSRDGFLIRPSSVGPAVKGFLCNNPFIITDRGKLVGVVFADGKEQLSHDFLEQTSRQYSLKGMAGLVVCTFGGVEGDEPYVVPSALSDRIAVRSVGRDSRDRRD